MRHTSTLAHNIVDRAERHGDRTAVSFTTGDGTWNTVTYRELAGRASALASSMRRGDFVLIMLPNSVEYVVSFYACMFAGAVAVPFYPPNVLTGRTAKAFAERLRQIRVDCAPSLIVLPRALEDLVRAELGQYTSELLAAEDLPATGGIGKVEARPGDLALLQYTSGSTTQPRGVMVSHANLVHNTAAFATALGSADGESIATWLPLFHDLGLIGTVLHPLAAGMTVHLTTPVAFVRRPYLWLEMASRSRASIVMAPNFAYDLCVRWISEEQRATLDLSALRVALNGAEPVRHTTIDAFLKAYERHGFRPSAMVPAYGLAEGTLCVTSTDPAKEPTLVEVSSQRLREDGVAVPADREPSTVIAGCGAEIADTDVVIVDPERIVAQPDGSVGEIWVTGPSVANGYWRHPELSERTFAAELPLDGRQFLRTGDLGLKLDGELFVVGRVKDMIIQYGVNHCPQDVEFTAERTSEAVRPGGAAVFTVPADGEERVVLVCELEAQAKDVDHPALLTALRTAVAEEHGLEVSTVGLVRKGQIPKTTSGKVRRRTSAERWLAGQFDTVAVWPTI